MPTRLLSNNARHRCRRTPSFFSPTPLFRSIAEGAQGLAGDSPVRLASRAASATFSQELIDRILGDTDKDTLKSCALVARSFRTTSQKLIFSDLTILPPGCDSIPALQRLANLLSASPHLALHVRTLRLVQPSFYAPCVWMQSDILPVILPLFTRLASLKISIYNWDFFHSDCEQAIHTLITQSQLSSIELEEARFQTNGLSSMLSRQPPICVFAAQKHAKVCAAAARRRSSRRNLPYFLEGQFLQTTNLRSMPSLRTLELSVELEWAEIHEAQGRYNPLNDVTRTLTTAPQTVEHLILNLQIRHSDDWERFLDYPLRDHPLEGLGERRPALRDVVVRIVFRHEPPALQQGIQYLKQLFHRLENRGMLTAVIIHPAAGQ
ncbi:hypothetical protein C8F04DRAFT_1174816 [Mycena alexandri]|uniref:Uncharacterized protein n=1 Tax=Mycena alexandri TaxID=1745969 RepID=A0AAD6TFU7_9AGAR|nr:hypothetical protein C8F04DRAFT_1174816 [Mycena alexandri]